MVRITGGQFKGRGLFVPSGDQTRPTLSKLRQALFNSLQNRIVDAKVIDLFSGSGALGFEALSWGAAQVVFVEKSKQNVKLIQKNAKELGVGASQIFLIPEPIERAMKILDQYGPFDIVLADPPYAEGWERKLFRLISWENLLRDQGVFCLEWGKQKSIESPLDQPLPFLVKIREKSYGDSVLTTYLKNDGALVKEC